MKHYRLLTVSAEGRNEESFEAEQEQAHHFALQSDAMKGVIVLWLKEQQDDGDWKDDEAWRPPRTP